MHVFILYLSLVSFLPISYRLLVCDFYPIALCVVFLLIFMDFFNFRKLRLIYLLILMLSIFMIATIQYINPY